MRRSLNSIGLAAAPKPAVRVPTLVRHFEFALVSQCHYTGRAE